MTGNTISGNAGTGTSIFNDAGYGKQWLGDFFPYQMPNADDVHAVLGKMLGIYNTGILVLASMVALYSLITFIVESAHHGEIGGRRRTSIYGQIRLLIAVALLTPVSHGYNAAQIIIVQLAHVGSGLANTAWREFTPYAATTDFDLPLSHGNAVNDLLQKALIDETCIAAVAGDKSQNANPSVTLEAFYRSPENGGREIEGKELPLKLGAADSGGDAMAVGEALQTEADIQALPISRLRLHFNRSGYDDFCGAIDFPVPSVPTGSAVMPAEQAVYVMPYLTVRPELGKYGQSMAAAVEAMLAPPAAKGQAANASAATALASQPGAPAQDTTTPSSPLASKARELPQASMSAQAWDEMVHSVEGDLRAAANQAGKDYIDPEAGDSKMQSQGNDWVTAGSLFFKLTKLSHDNAKLRMQPMGASLPDSSVLPAEMRADGQVAQCPQILDTYILPDYHCRQEGKKTMLSIKVAYNLIHAVESQRGTDVVPAIDGAPAASRKEDTASARLFANAGLDGVVAEFADMARPRHDADRPSAMFDAVNLGNMLLLSTSGLFAQAAQNGQDGTGSLSQGMLLTIFASLLTVPAFLLSLVLPLLPAIRFFIGVATWLLTVFEALVSFPLVILSSMRSDEDSVLSYGRHGYIMVLQMMLRPVLMVFGMMAAIMVFDALYRLATWTVWTALLNVAADSGEIVGGGVQGVLELTGYIMLWTFFVYMSANISFRAITLIPDRVLAWIGVQGGSAVRVTAEAPIVAAPITNNGYVREPLPRAIIENDVMNAQIARGKDTASVTGDRPPAPPATGQKNIDHFPTQRGP